MDFSTETLAAPSVSAPAGSESTLVLQVEHTKVSNGRRYLLLFLFSVAQFIDVQNISSLFSAVPKIAEELSMTESQSSWLVTAYQLTFAAFLLLGGRLSDIYNPKYLFITGFGCVGIFSLINGFIDDTIGLIVLRAIVGLFAAMSIPSALSLIIHLFPEPREQGQAISMFSGSGAIGNVLGLIIGAVFVQYVTWHWVFWFPAIIAVPVATICMFLIPGSIASERASKLADPGVAPVSLSATDKLRRLDVVGVSILTSAVILFIYGVTSGPVNGWSSPNFLAPFIISIPLVVVFFIYEQRSPEWRAALPPRVWFYPNFGVWFAIALFPYTWFTGVFLLLTSFWQDDIKWTPIIAAVHFIPFGVTAFFIIFFLVGPLQRRLGDRPMALLEGSLLMISSILLAFADRPSRYWSFVFPAFIIGACGTGILFTHVNVSIFKTAPASQSGVVGAILNSAQQLGSAIGTAALTAIQSNIDNKQPPGSAPSYKGRAAGFWWLLALAAVETIGFVVFYRDAPTPTEVPRTKMVKETDTQDERAEAYT